MNKFGFNDVWVKSISLKEFKDWCADNQAKHEMNDTDIEAYWNSLQPPKVNTPLPQSAKTSKGKQDDNGGNEGKPIGATI